MNDSYDRVGRSPLNCSPTKQLYSFPKANRFNYTPRPYFMTRKASQHLEQQLLATVEEKIQRGVFHLRQIVIDLRLNLTETSSKEKVTDSVMVIGRAIYNKRTEIHLVLERTIRKSIDSLILLSAQVVASKIKDRKILMQKYGKMKPVGPGNYLLPSMNKTGEYFYSKYHNSGCARTSRCSRFNYEYSQTPGPGSYYPEQFTDINKQGVYLNSKYKSTHAVKFIKPYQSPTRERSTSPGPGSYHPFSEFGRRNKSTLRI